jgi:hypothetical protein
MLEWFRLCEVLASMPCHWSVNMDVDEYNYWSDYEWISHYRGFEIVVERMIPTTRNPHEYDVSIITRRYYPNVCWNVRDLHDMAMTIIIVFEWMDLCPARITPTDPPPDLWDPLV